MLQTMGVHVELLRWVGDARGCPGYSVAASLSPTGAHSAHSHPQPHRRPLGPKAELVKINLSLGENLWEGVARPR